MDNKGEQPLRTLYEIFMNLPPALRKLSSSSASSLDSVPSTFSVETSSSVNQSILEENNGQNTTIQLPVFSESKQDSRSITQSALRKLSPSLALSLDSFSSTSSLDTSLSVHQSTLEKKNGQTTTEIQPPAFSEPRQDSRSIAQSSHFFYFFSRCCGCCDVTTERVSDININPGGTDPR